MADPLIKDVSDTAYWIAHHRAQESARPDALFRDPMAARLAGEHGSRISAAMPSSYMIGWTVVIRTCIIDRYIRSAIAAGVDAILNLGAGLDTRPYRMDLPATLRWIEADYPHLIDYKEGVLGDETPRCKVERVKIDLADRARRRVFLGTVAAHTRKMLVLTEGVIPYLSEREAGSLADDLRMLSPVRYWIVDYFSPDAMKFRRRNNMGRQMQNAPFKFEPADWHGFFREHGWEAKEEQFLAEEGEKLGRPLPLPAFAQLFWSFWGLFMSAERKEALQRFAGYALLTPR